MITLAWFGLPGGAELIIFLFIILIFFGKRLPHAMFSVGKSITEFKKGVNEGMDEDEEEGEEGDEDETVKKSSKNVAD